MATVTPQGITPTTLPQYVTRLGSVWQTALGADLSLATETPQGQIIDGLAIVFAELDEAVVAVGNGYSLDRAAGVAQDDQADLLNVERRRATRSVVTATMGGVAGTNIPMNSRVATAANEVFATSVAVLIPAAGTIDVEMVSVNFGAIPASAGGLTTIIDVIAGWETATNAAAASLGDTEESQSEFRLRYRRHVGRNASTPVQAIEARLLEVAGVTDALVRDNSTGASVTVQGQAIAARAVYAAVQGGTDAAVAATFYGAKTAGAPTVGATTVAVNQLDADGVSVGTVDVNFDRVTLTPITVAFTVTPGPTFPGDGLMQINAGLVAYVEQQGVSDPVDSTRILTPILSVPGHMIGTVTIAKKTGAGDITMRADVDLNEKLTLAAADITITVS